MVLITFVGGSYGDFYPIGAAARVLVCLLSACGLLFQLFLIALVIHGRAAEASAGADAAGGAVIHRHCCQ
eukprot:SAG25_NODE_10134_length_345_cov_0.634146_1_plen_70_part_01